MRTCTIYHLQCTMGLRLGGVNVDGGNACKDFIHIRHVEVAHLKLYIVNGK